MWGGSGTALASSCLGSISLLLQGCPFIGHSRESGAGLLLSYPHSKVGGLERGGKAVQRSALHGASAVSLLPSKGFSHSTGRSRLRRVRERGKGGTAERASWCLGSITSPLQGFSQSHWSFATWQMCVSESARFGLFAYEGEWHSPGIILPWQWRLFPRAELAPRSGAESLVTVISGLWPGSLELVVFLTHAVGEGSERVASARPGFFPMSTNSQIRSKWRWLECEPVANAFSRGV